MTLHSMDKVCKDYVMQFFSELYKIFFGSLTFLHIVEILFRTTFIYFYTIINVRLMDKRSMGLLNSFEVIIIIALGSAVGDPMFYRDIPLVQGMVVISMIVFLERVVSRVSTHFTTFEKLISGSPALLIKHGSLQQKELIRQNISLYELNSILRLHGIKKLHEVEMAYLEPSGSISIIRKNGSNFDPIHVKKTI